jgi:DNA-binding NarL/FixJ family response regulator
MCERPGGRDFRPNRLKALHLFARRHKIQGHDPPGDALLAPAVTRRLVSEFARLRPALPRSPDALSELTPRETEVLRLVAEGLSNGEIAERLVVSDETVKTHVSRILGKLAVRDRTQAVVVAYESGLVTPRTREAVD